MEKATVQELKQQLRLDNDDEDLLLQLYLDAAFEVLELLLNKKIYTEEPGDGTTDESYLIYDNSVKIAHLQIAGEQYKNREVTSDKAQTELPCSVAKFIEQKRVWFGGK